MLPIVYDYEFVTLLYFILSESMQMQSARGALKKLEVILKNFNSREKTCWSLSFNKIAGFLVILTNFFVENFRATASVDSFCYGCTELFNRILVFLQRNRT